eukprot:TRINITY_DN6537_c0_g1_i1.p1 TRINITY_DN6537_c0_g1~~TRINITY_DN6537_c0_g1_i1.p1  ORF type:complete len:248 (+),score=26.62 TRINITY_DN6537_c0_g1_i1:94-837(+)
MAFAVSGQTFSSCLKIQKDLSVVPATHLSSAKSFVPNALPVCKSRARASAPVSAGALSVTASVAVATSELDVISKFSEIVPDTIIGDDFERFKPTAATVSSSLILGFSSLPDAKFDGAIRNALAYGKCMLESGNKMSCFLDKALVNVGKELTKDVSGRVSTEIDPRLAHNTDAIVQRVHELLDMYDEVEVHRNRVLFKIPATWEGIEAARKLEAEGIQTHVTGVNRQGSCTVLLMWKIQRQLVFLLQ